MSVGKATIVSQIKVNDTFSNAPAASTIRNFVEMSGFDDSHELTASTTPDADDSCHFEVTLAAGVATIDLTALSGVDSATKNFNGKKLRALKCRVKTGNAGAFTIKKGAANGYAGFGANFEITLPAVATGGAWFEIYDAGGASAISGTNKTLDISGTGTQVLQVAVVVGD